MTKNSRRRGRPAFKATPILRAKVERLVASGMTAIEIGRALGCNDDTLRKHFSEELATGAAKRRAEAVELLWKSARAGNVSAQKKVEEMTGRALAEETFTSAPAPVAHPRPARVGKKEAAAEAAANAGTGTSWEGDLTPPPSALRN